MRPAVRRILDDPAFPDLKRFVIGATGMAFYADKDDALAAILARRLEASGAGSGGAYLSLLGHGDAGAVEQDALVAELTIGETYFFRHAAQWDALANNVLPEIIERNRTQRRLRVWSAGCATGPEPYTLAILLKDRFGRQIEGWDVRVLGTDINRRFLALARQARYGEWSFRATPDDLRARCFSPAKDGWELKPAYRELVEFRHHNLATGAIPPDPDVPVDLILCRNVIIYFDAETNRRLVARFHTALPEGGWLVMGHSEPDTRLFRDFQPVLLPDAVLYRKGTAKPEAPALPAKVPSREPRRETRSPEPPKPKTPPVVAHPVPPPAKPIEAPPPAAADDGFGEIRRLIGQGRWDAAGAACAELLARNPMDALAHFHLGLLFEQRGEPVLGEESYRRALFLDRSLSIAHYHLGLLLRRRGDIAGARRSFRNVLSSSTRHDADAPLPGTDEIPARRLRDAADRQLETMDA